MWKFDCYLLSLKRGGDQSKLVFLVVMVMEVLPEEEEDGGDRI